MSLPQSFMPDPCSSSGVEGAGNKLPSRDSSTSSFTNTPSTFAELWARSVKFKAKVKRERSSSPEIPTVPVTKRDNLNDPAAAKKVKREPMSQAQKTPVKRDGPPAQALDSPIVRLLSVKKAWIEVHSGLLIHYSSYFSTIFQGKPIDAKSKFAQVDVLDEIGLHCFRTWLYWQTFETPEAKESDSENPAVQNQAPPTQLTLCKLWVFAERYSMPKMQNDVIRTIHKSISETRFISTATTRYVYEHAKTGSLLRKLIIKQYLVLADGDFTEGGRWDEWRSTAFLVDLATGFADLSDTGGRSKNKQAIWRNLDLEPFLVPEEKRTTTAEPKRDETPSSSTK